MSDSNIKQLKVTGDAADSFLKRAGHLSRKRGRRTSRVQEGGTSPGTIVQIQANRVPSIASVPNSGNASNLAKTVTESTPATTAQEQSLKGGVQEKHTPVKVVLAAGKPNKNVVLAPAKVKKAITHTPSQTQKTRKIAKRIRMSIGGLSKRVTRANHIRGESRKQDISAIKKTLVEAKLIKVESKAPESILRSMYSDYMMLKNKAL